MGKRRVFVTSGRKGGKQRALNLSPQERSDAARKAVLVRWARHAARKEKE